VGGAGMIGVALTGSSVCFGGWESGVLALVVEAHAEELRQRR
jgi:hypothetical protein